MRSNGIFWFLGLALLLLLPAPTLSAAEGSDGPASAEMKVTGLGWLKNREMRLSLNRLVGADRGPTLDANAIEDAALLLISDVTNRGYLKPRLIVDLVTENGEKRRIEFDQTLETLLPRPLYATEVLFTIERGRRYVVEEVRISGLTVLPLDDAKAFFRPDGALFGRAAARAYTPGALNGALDSLQDELRQRGYADAVMRAADVRIDDETGQVFLAIEVQEGPRWEVTELNVAGVEAEMREGIEERFLHQPWSPLWQQDVREALRQALYRRGYPDVRTRVTPRVAPATDGVRNVAVTVYVTPGQQVEVGEVRFEGNDHTQDAVLRRRVQADPGEPLNPLALERARYRLSRLGVFERVDLRLEPSEGPVRDPVFILNEGRRREANLLLGYGSYEQVRGGIEFRQMNLFGRAHQSRLTLVQSMKSSRGDYTYTVPELFGESVDGTARVFGLQRQERAFLRQEFGGSVVLKRPVPWINAEGSVGYTFQALRSKENELGTRADDNEAITVASIDVAFTRDRRDNPLRPRRGYRWFTQLELASQHFGGESDYQRLELGAAHHWPWGRSRWVHVGVTHGLVTTYGTDDDALLPVNKRFFPGGDSTVRGFHQGEAAPRNADGRSVGAKTYLLVNAELEQALTTNWSAVVFVDAIGVASRLGAYPFEQDLYSAGLGIRYQTLIGPVRLEYGRNLNPRPGDPSGTFHLSVGFPF